MKFEKSTRTLTFDYVSSFLKDFESGDYRMNIAIIEDSLTGDGVGWDQRIISTMTRNIPNCTTKVNLSSGTCIGTWSGLCLWVPGALLKNIPVDPKSALILVFQIYLILFRELEVKDCTVSCFI